MFRILVTCFNAEKFIVRCLETIKIQSFTNWKCYVMDDLSTDNSLDLGKEKYANDDRFVFIKNSKKLYQIGNYEEQIKNFEDDDICLTIDSDDYLPDIHVFERINQAYKEDVYMTYGRYLEICENGIVNYGIGKEIEDIGTLRQQVWFLSHLRTWKVFLWRRIPKYHLINPENNSFWTVAGDMAFMFSMVEIAKEKVKFLNSINYCYDRTNPLGNHHIRMEQQQKNEKLIRELKPYISKFMV